MQCVRRRAALLAASILIPFSSANAESKVEPAVEQELVEHQSARVIIATRPDPDAASGGLSMSAPQQYVSQLLAQDAAAIKPIGGLRAVATNITSAQLEKLKSDPNVEAVFADVAVPPLTDVTVHLIGADQVHGRGFLGTNLAVAILDTGIDASHPAFQNAMAGEACFSTTAGGAHPSTTLCPNNLDMDLTAGAARKCPAAVRGCDHGTHVAGIVAGRAVTFNGKSFAGVSPAARVVPIQVFSLFAGTEDCRGASPCVLSYTSDQLRALDWVYKNREALKIASINMSLGGGYYDHACDTESALTELIQRLRAKGILTVIAAGNDRFYDGVAMPGCISSAITVAASDKSGVLDISYSNVGPQVDVVAPGSGIQSSIFGAAYGSKSGTSMAAPHVAGAVALLRNEYPAASAQDLENKLVVGAPAIVDARTGRNMPGLELARSIPPLVGGPAVVTLPAGVTPAPMAAPVEQSFIISTTGNDQQVASSVASACAQSCDLKRISDTAWKLDVEPSAAMLKNKPGLSAGDLRKVLGNLPADAKVYANTPAAPLSAPK